MCADIFIDTNILVYAFDRDAGIKHEKARDLISGLWKEGSWPWISVQVLLELYVNLTRKGLDDDEAFKIVEEYSAWNVVENELSLFFSGLKEKSRWGLSLWDSMILAAARKAGVSKLLTEDLNDSQDYNGIIAVNPLK